MQRMPTGKEDSRRRRDRKEIHAMAENRRRIHKIHQDTRRQAGADNIPSMARDERRMVAEWETENGRTLVALAVTKDVQDSILNDPIRSKIVDIIDIEQWYNHQKGQYAPPGGMNMAPRQYMRKIRGGSVRFDDVYRAVAEYRTSYPDKAVIYSAQKYPEMGWAALMAGGSCANVPVNDKMFLAFTVLSAQGSSRL